MDRKRAAILDQARVLADIVPPMHSTLVDKVPEGRTGCTKSNGDGCRIGVYLVDGQVRILTRNLHDWTNRSASIVEAVCQLDAKDAMIDGEAFVADSRDARFQSAATCARQGLPSECHHVRGFDLTLLDGEDLRHVPLTKRREILFDLLPSLPPGGIIFSD